MTVILMFLRVNTSCRKGKVLQIFWYSIKWVPPLGHPTKRIPKFNFLILYWFLIHLHVYTVIYGSTR